MGIDQSGRHKRRATGGKKPITRVKRKYSLGRQPALTKIGTRVVRNIRVRGGHHKFRALRLDVGSFSWSSEAVSRKARIISVVYSSCNNDYVRTNTLVKSNVLQIDATPFKHYYEQTYGILLGKAPKVSKKSKKEAKSGEKKVAGKKTEKKTEKKVEHKPGEKKAEKKPAEKKPAEKKPAEKKSEEKSEKKPVEKKAAKAPAAAPAKKAKKGEKSVAEKVEKAAEKVAEKSPEKKGAKKSRETC